MRLRAWWLALGASGAAACTATVLDESDHGVPMAAVRVEIPLEPSPGDAATASQHVELAATGATGSVGQLDYELLELQASWSGSREYESGTRASVRAGIGYSQAAFDVASGPAAEFDVDSLSVPVGFSSETPFASVLELELRGQWAFLIGDDFGQSIQLEAAVGWRVAEGFVVAVGWRWWRFQSSAIADPAYDAVELALDGPVFTLGFRR